MTFENDFFLLNDTSSKELLDWHIPDTWWSRRFEYPWAMGFADQGQVVADFGCGYHFRPFKDALSKTCDQVYAIDRDERVLALNAEYPFPDNMIILVEDMEQETSIIENSLDRVFCISVLEELENPDMALIEMRRVLKNDGFAILTFDVILDDDLPLGQYKGIAVDEILRLAAAADLIPREELHYSIINRLANKSLNLCVYHLVLMPA